MGIIVLFLLNFVFLGVLLVWVRRYIRREVGKAEYARHLERELQGLLIEVNRSGAEITEVIEQRSEDLQKLLAKQDTKQKFWEEQHSLWEGRAAQLQHFDEQLELQRRSVRELQGGAELQALELRLQSLEADLQEFREKKEGIKTEILEVLDQKWQEKFGEYTHQIRGELGEWQEKQGRVLETLEQKIADASIKNESSQKPLQKTLQNPSTGSLPNSSLSSSPGSALLTDEQRAEIKRYIELGLDARIISQKTGVPLNLIDILVAVTDP